MNFQDLSLAEPILKALDREGYSTPTPIQQQAIPPVLEGRDILGIAQTGTGKTAAFALPILTRLAANPKPAPKKGCRALVLSPTRELASQIADSFRTYARFMDITVAVIFGGVDMRKQIHKLAPGVDVIVATPGRLIDHMGQRTADLSGTEIFVLDEADQMLDMGFVKPIRQIANALSHRRQNLFFSATMPKEIAGLAEDLLNDPVRVSVAPVSATADRIDQRVILIEKNKKRSLLVSLFTDETMTRSLVFTRTKRGADRVARHLETAGIPAASIHGNKSQSQREKALAAFRNDKTKVLVATDIAARGIDIDLVSHVVNFDLPEVPEAYVHRIGRTARAGASGRAVSLCDMREERDLLRAIEKLTRQTIPTEDRRGDDTLEAQKEPPRNPAEGRGENRRTRRDSTRRPYNRDERASQRREPLDRPAFVAQSATAERSETGERDRSENQRGNGWNPARGKSASIENVSAAGTQKKPHRKGSRPSTNPGSADDQRRHASADRPRNGSGRNDRNKGSQQGLPGFISDGGSGRTPAAPPSHGRAGNRDGARANGSRSERPDNREGQNSRDRFASKRRDDRPGSREQRGARDDRRQTASRRDDEPRGRDGGSRAEAPRKPRRDAGNDTRGDRKEARGERNDRSRNGNGRSSEQGANGANRTREGGRNRSAGGRPPRANRPGRSERPAEALS